MYPNRRFRAGRARGVALTMVLLSGMGLVAACGSSPASSRATPDIAPGASALVPYCNGETMQITRPQRHALPSPAVIYLHGGSWIGGDHTSGGFIIDQIGPALNRKGFLVASANYRLGPHERWPAQIVDVKCAVRYLRAHAQTLHIDAREIGIWGHSAGGHLASLVGTTGPDARWDTGPYPGRSSAVEAVADFAGPSNLVTMGEEGAPGAVRNNFVSLFGPLPAEQIPGELKAASPVTYVSAKDPPFLIIHGDRDPIVPLTQSQELAHALQSVGDPVTLVVVKAGGHALDEPGARPGAKEIVAMTVEFFMKQLARTP